MKQSLEKLLNHKVDHVHFIGIGGASMSGLASILLHNGIHVSGSDIASSENTEKLRAKGADIRIPHNTENIDPSYDLVVYTAAVKSDNPERREAQRLSLPIMERSDFLGLLTRTFEHTIAVSGTHGKTTTTSMISSILYEGGLDPTVTVGGHVDVFNGNYHIGENRFFITEACEYVDSFLKSFHKTGVILNIEEDHMDYFENLKAIQDSFKKFARIIPQDGYLVVNGDSPAILDVVTDLPCTLVTCGYGKDNRYQARKVEFDALGNGHFDVYKDGRFFESFDMVIPGEHNVLNALCAIAVSDLHGVEKKAMKTTLSSFKGAKRRFDLVGKEKGITVIDDFAHHPTELKATIKACKNFDHNNLWVVFQPYTYSRTYYFFDEFVASFAGADRVIINDISSDRETNQWDIADEDLSIAIQKNLQIPAVHLSTYAEIVDYLMDHVESGDLVLVAGAKTIYQTAYSFIERLKKQ
ncbi:MAG TPA: UDP-N-acetylmuramate--L-alanine ligase [Eubacteriaceae bacterium]|nr:UDP-N-acetylmuramate--L-alanine ligase [Eubacteriaceae bacterium]